MTPPKTRSPAAANGRVNRKTQALVGAEIPTYNPGESVSSVSVYSGRKYLGTVRETGDSHQAVNAAGTPLGAFPTRIAAARALSEVAHG
jgi:hypothetical protein